MSTRSYVGYYNEETKKVNYNYVHFDGYLDGVGETLINAFNSIEKAKEIGDCKTSIRALNDDGTIDAYSDEDQHEEQPTMTLEEYIKDDDIMIEYVYVFKDGVWNLVHKHKRLITVEYAIKREQARIKKEQEEEDDDEDQSLAKQEVVETEVLKCTQVTIAGFGSRKLW